jgi:hypothetical protein
VIPGFSRSGRHSCCLPNRPWQHSVGLPIIRSSNPFLR